MSQAESLPGQAVPRLQSSAAGDIRRHHRDPVSFLSARTLRHDSHIGFTREVSSLNLFSSLPSWVFRELPGKEGADLGALVPVEGQEPGAANFHFSAIVPIRASEWRLVRPGWRASERKSLLMIPLTLWGLGREGRL